MVDRDAEFNDFVNASAVRLLRAAQLLTADRHSAEDLLQDVLARTYMRWERIDGNPEAYVRRGLLNGQRSWWRSKGRHQIPFEHIPDLAASGDLAAAHASSDAVLHALSALTRRERSVIVLRFWLDLTEAATAAELGIAVGTVKSTTARALTRLRASEHLSHPRTPAQPPASTAAVRSER